MTNEIASSTSLSLCDYYNDHANGRRVIDVKHDNILAVTHALIAKIHEHPEDFAHADLQASQWSPPPLLFTFSSSKNGPDNCVLNSAVEWGSLVGQTNAVYGFGGGNMGAMGGASTAFHEARKSIEPDAFSNGAIHLIEVTTPKFFGNEVSLPGALTLRASNRRTHNISIRKDLIGDLINGFPDSALISLAGGQGTDDENEHILSRFGYEDKTYPPFMLVNTPLSPDNPAYHTNYPGFYDFWIEHKRRQIAMGLTRTSFLQAATIAPTPRDTMAYLLDTMPGLKWLGAEEERPKLDIKAIEELIPQDLIV